MREVEMMRKYNYDHKKAHDLLKEEFVKDLLKENKLLTRQLSYIRSGEYYNQLKFERNMLEDVVSKGEVSEIDKAFIDMTHRNTELLEENQELKKQLEEKENIACNWKDSCLENAGKIEKLENQQKEFIEYLTSYIYLLSNKPDLIEEAEIDILEEILSKYKEILGGKE